MPLQHLSQAREVITEIREVASDKSGLGVLCDRTFEDVNHTRKLDDVRLIVQPPMEGIHQAVIVTVHWLIHPDGVRNMYAHGHSQLPASFEQRIHARVIWTPAVSPDGLRNESLPCTGESVASARSRCMALRQRPGG